MPKKKQTTRAGTSATKLRATALTKRIEQWSEANGDDARAETMQVLLARGSRAKKRKPQRTKTQVASALGE
jgi:hypothetical protein